jgi:hypothetical protein
MRLIVPTHLSANSVWSGAMASTSTTAGLRSSKSTFVRGVGLGSRRANRIGSWPRRRRRPLAAEVMTQVDMSHLTVVVSETFESVTAFLTFDTLLLNFLR